MAATAHIWRLALIVGLLIAVSMSAQKVSAQQRGVTIELKAREDRNAPVVERVRLYPRSYALVIGNDDYRDPYWVKLSNGVRDAREVAAALEAKGFEVTLKENLDGDALEEALEAFFFERGQDFEARLFVWYAGHGHTEAGEGYLVPVDAPDPDASATFRRTALSLRRMGEYARGANAHHVLAVFDSCFAGTVFEVQRTAPPAAITHATTRPVRQFITSGDAGQTVSDDGTFRRIFIEAIGGERRADLNADGYVTASELGLFLADRITNYSNGTQTPRYGKLRDPNWDQGDFVFSLAALTPSSQPALAVEERDETLVALKNANVRAAPETGGTRLTTLARGSNVAVTGKVAQRDWLRVTLKDGRTGYVWAPLLGEGVPGPERTTRPGTQVAVGSYPPQLPAGAVFRDCGDCPEMVVVPAGSFTMGSPDNEPERESHEGPQRRVTIPVAFAIGKYEVTFEEWDACVDAGGCTHRPDEIGWVRERRPVVNVSWNDAQTYVSWLSQKTGQNYRLPSEAEWEYAARAGTTTPFHTGERIATSQANFFGTVTYNGSTVGSTQNDITPVGRYDANDFGLHDMHGNVAEWVEDCYRDSYAGAPDDGRPWGAADCERRIRRGGNWLRGPVRARSAYRSWSAPDTRDAVGGFRVARTLSQ